MASFRPTTVPAISFPSRSRMISVKPATFEAAVKTSCGLIKKPVPLLTVKRLSCKASRSAGVAASAETVSSVTFKRTLSARESAERELSLK